MSPSIDFIDNRETSSEELIAELRACIKVFVRFLHSEKGLSSSREIDTKIRTFLDLICYITRQLCTLFDNQPDYDNQITAIKITYLTKDIHNESELI